MASSYLPRHAESALREILQSGKIGIILGARQVGKSTLAEHVLAGTEAAFLNFDVEVDRARFRAAAALAPADVLRYLGAPSVIVIDEAQRIPETSRIVKGWHDQRVPVSILLLGSSSLELLGQTGDSLSGRNRKLVLTPLVFREALASQAWAGPSLGADGLVRHFAPQVRAFLLQRLVWGSYPEVVTHGDPVRVLRELTSDYLWKDVLQAGLLRTPEPFRKLLLLLAHQAGSEVSISELAVQLGAARQTVERYLDLLEQTFVVFRLRAYSTNPRKEISKSQKVFFWDTGVRNALLGTCEVNEYRPDIGSLWENWVVAEAAKHNARLGFPAELFFWRTHARSEVDLVVRQGDALRAFEVKWSPRRVAGRAFEDAYGVKVATITPEQPFVEETLRAAGVLGG